MNVENFVYTFPSLLFKITIILSVLWLVHGVLRSFHPGLRMTLWRAAAVSLLLLPAVGLFVPRWRAEPLAPVLAPVGALTENLARPIKADFAPSTSPQPNTIQSPVRRGTLGMILVGVWSFGVLCFGTAQLIASIRLRRVLANAESAPEEIVQRADAIARTLGRPLDFSVCIVGNDRSPFLAGIAHPIVAIPRGIAESPRDLDAVLAHELTHRAGSDHRWAVLIQIARILWWAHPLTWGMSAAHRAACEENSDAIASRFDGDRAWYSSLLARMALTTAAAPPTMAISMLNGSEIMERLRRLARGDERRPLVAGTRTAVGTVALGVALLIGTMAVGTTGPSLAQESSPGIRSMADVDLLERLSRRGDPEGRSEALLDVRTLLESGVPANRMKALATLQATADLKLDRTGLLDPVRQCILDPSSTIRTSAIPLLPLLGGGAEDLPYLATLIRNPLTPPAVLCAIGNTIFWLGPKEATPERDAMILHLLSRTDPEVIKETLRGSWGHPVGEVVEIRMVALSFLPEFRSDAVYFALSTRPVKSHLVAQRLIEVMKSTNGGESASRAQWGLTHWPTAPDAQQMVFDELMARYDELSGSIPREEILHYLGSHACGKGTHKLKAIAADEEEVDRLREKARQLLERGC